MKKQLALLILGLIFTSCKVSKVSKSIKADIKESAFFAHNFTGVSLFDLQENKNIFGYNADKYFMPASNAKLFSFYAGLKILGDSIPALRYVVRNDSLIFWGTGDPSFLHPDLKSTTVFEFLKNRKEKLFFSNANNIQPVFGEGWTWDDFNDYYQAETNGMPIYGNIVRFSNQNNNLKASPSKIVTVTSKTNYGRIVIRDVNQNNFNLPNGSLDKKFEQDVPFKTSSENVLLLLSDTLKRDVQEIALPLPKSYKSLFSIKSDSLYKRMLHVSDNMLAEQLILLCSKADTLNTQKSIESIMKNYLSDLPDKARWVDGSGLSRYNLFTPRSIVKLLQKIYQEVPKERLFELLPAGGQPGTLRNMFKGNQPFIFAKSGSFSNNYNLSGYLIGRSGKTYLFSFMNNSFMNPMSEIRKEVDRILTNIHEKL